MLTFVDLYFIINIKANYVYLQWFADFMLTNLWRKKMDNYNNNGYNNDSLNNPQGNGSDPQQNNYSNQGYQQPYGTDNNQGYQQPYGTDNNQGYQQQSYGANDYQQPYGSQPDYSNYNQNNYQQQYPNYNQYPVEDKSAKNNATASLVLGIIGLCCCAPCGIVGLILGINSKKAKPENNGLATAGIILSIIALVIWAILLITQIVSGAFISSIS